MHSVLSQLRAGNWRALLASFLYFDTGFTVWLLYGPLAPYMLQSLHLSPMQQGYLVAIPVLSAAILRIGFGNLYQAVDGRWLALVGVTLSAIPPLVLSLYPATLSYEALIFLGILLGVGGASFAVALPMAGSNYPPKVQGTVLGIAAAGNIGAVLDGFLFPPLANHFGWAHATAAVLPLLALAGLTLWFWGKDRAPKTGKVAPAAWGWGITLIGLAFLAVVTPLNWLGLQGKAALLMLPVYGVLLSLVFLPRRYVTVLRERDTWALILVYAITFGGFVGMSAFVSLLLVTLYHLPKIDAGMLMGIFAFTGAILRPFGGIIADRISGAIALRFFLAGICLIDTGFSLWTPTLPVSIALFLLLYSAFGLGNGATFQLVPLRWPEKTGLMTGIIGAAGGIGGFYLPVILGIAKEQTGNYHWGFGIFAGLSATALLLVFVLRHSWQPWSRSTVSEEHAVPQQTLQASAITD
ncbi:NarK/NasA family nitrate transporter [Acidithiobacillus caldus]|jgi:NNP family nitrate/nitrite transporter-like MFS transporter|uniref:Major facilitator superfamily MFS_1 n=1 Tax=Acidithiobacillus caldus (strain SM-1) TaxID=990288 RepID=F9ZLT6_ACICS|nr:MFS transporter [Acidithiobacillus caldus]AEK57777.1 major facilitator superfamily MFS_1 [Acidithiobacillus caldus SM-1]AUW32463.1 NarK/NasA family nitrate transporter [Acidithiobacillus caldus]MBU2783734.1 NarK/NasA family nitrate transporter [Acidithiobacillus caldus]MBU2789549.1 NarK/NasA family nitrate transporter [Acidithiobacillus caldus]MBU2822112.1 NarK/NasA family nitrate transporter [Acidithiobacillus caldus]